MSLLSRDEITKLRSPIDQRKFALEVISALYKDSEEKKRARENKGVYKEFREEFVPFSAICVEYYEFRNDCNCGLAEDPSGNHDAVVHLPDGTPHIFEFTKVIDGRAENAEMKQLNADGQVFNLLGAYDDVQIQTSIANNAITTAHKKTLKTYQTDAGPSTLIIQIWCEEFHDDNPHHQEVMSKMLRDLSELNYKVDEVIIMKISFDNDGHVYNYIKIK